MSVDRSLRLTLAFLLLAAPGALATDGGAPMACHELPGAARACVTEWKEGDACREQDSMDWGYTAVHVGAGGGLVRGAFEGSYECWRFDDGNGGDERFDGRDVRGALTVAGARVGMAWTSSTQGNSEESETECQSTLSASLPGVASHPQDLGCPWGAPPAVAWGEVLP